MQLIQLSVTAVMVTASAPVEAYLVFKQKIRGSMSAKEW